MAQEKVTGQCPRCGKASHWKGNRYRPFCSERCKLIDLGNRRWPFGQWIDEEYRIAGENPLPNEKEPKVALTKGSLAKGPPPASVWPEGRGGGK